MNERTTARPAFTELPERGRRVGPPECHWDRISLDGMMCSRPSHMQRSGSLLLCEEHAREVARLVGYASVEGARHLAERRVITELETLRAENARLRAPARSVSAPKRETPTDGTIYYLRSGGYFKIGWTSDLEKRMKGYPPDTQLLATRPGTKADERAIHKRFAHLLSHGREWFPLAGEIQDHIDAVIAEHGAPPVVDFTARRANRTAGRQTQYVGGPNRGALATRTVRG